MNQEPTTITKGPEILVSNYYLPLRCYVLASAAALMLSACAGTPTERSSAPSADTERPASFDPATAVPVNTREQFLSEVGSRDLQLMHPTLDATLTFEDGTAEGTLMRPGEAPVAMALEWEWTDGTYCRTGTLGSTELSRECERVTLYPGVGVELDYTTSDDATEFWEFIR